MELLISKDEMMLNFGMSILLILLVLCELQMLQKVLSNSEIILLLILQDPLVISVSVL